MAFTAYHEAMLDARLAVTDAKRATQLGKHAGAAKLMRAADKHLTEASDLAETDEQRAEIAAFRQHVAV